MTTITKRASGSLNIAKLIIEMQEQGFVPYSYNLPNITFVPEGSISVIPELENSTLQYLVEEKINMLNSPSKIVQTDLNGLLDIADGKDYIPSSGLKVMISPNGSIALIQVLDNCELKNYSLNKLRRAAQLLDEYAAKDINYKKLKVDILLKIKSLKGE